MKKIFFATIVALAALVSCNKNNEPAKPAVKANLTASSSFTDGKAKATVTLTEAVEADVTVELAVAADSQLGADVVTVEPASAVIKAGETKVEFAVVLGEAEAGDYTVKVELKSVSAPVEKGESVASIKATIEAEALMAVDMHNYKANATFLFDDNSIATGSNYTFEWKFYPYAWHEYDKTVEEGDIKWKTYCNRLGQVSNADENGILIRYGDGGASGSLRVNGKKYDTSNGQDYFGRNKETWALDQWHTLTIAVDAETMTVYDNGELFGTMPVVDGKGFNFERLDMSMTWGYDAAGKDYPWAQDFHGYIEYIRFWNKTLTQEEVKAGLCKVAKNAEGLQSLWIFNTDSGSVIPDQVGPRNLDYANAWVWYNAVQGKATGTAEAILEQWVEWDEATMGAMCPEL